MKYEPINTGLLSFGMSGRLFHAPFLHSHPGFIFYAVTERHQKKANQFYPVVRSFDSTEALMQDPALELIVVNTPNNTHFEYARQALMAGKNVLIEKPFATSVAETIELFDLAKKLDLEVMAYQNRRWDSDFQSVKYVVENGKLGKLVEAHFRFDRYKMNIEQKPFKEDPIPGSGLAYNLGPHVLDQVISLFGIPLRCQKTTTSNRPNSKVDDYGFFHFMYPDNLNVYVCISLLVPRPLQAFVLHGTKGSYIKDRTDIQEKQLDQGVSPLDESYGLELPGAEGELTIIDASGKKTIEYVPSLRGNYAGLFEAVYQQVRNKEPFPVTRKDILCQMAILEQENA
jgi:scyllo-inositol 2-dehydrogenase (NADP+)